MNKPLMLAIPNWPRTLMISLLTRIGVPPGTAIRKGPKTAMRAERNRHTRGLMEKARPD